MPSGVVVTYWSDDPIVTWEQAKDVSRNIEKLTNERGEVERVTD